MGTVELQNGQLIIQSRIITYGNAADPTVTENIRDEIATMWNEPRATIAFKKTVFQVVFRISATCKPGITPEEIFGNTNPQNNYFRIETFAMGNISFVDGLGCNSGYFKLENLYKKAQQPLRTNMDIHSDWSIQPTSICGVKALPALCTPGAPWWILHFNIILMQKQATAAGEEPCILCTAK